MLYLKAILRQEIVFFDTETSTGEVVGRISGDTVQEAMGNKVSLLAIIPLQEIIVSIPSNSMLLFLGSLALTYTKQSLKW